MSNGKAKEKAMSEEKIMETITVNGVEYVRKGGNEPGGENVYAEKHDGMPFVICRGYYCGVHAGYMKSREGNYVTLVDSRRLWYWKAKEGISLSAVAKYGIASEIELPNVLPYIWLGDVYEVIPCTDAAAKSILEAKIHEQG